MKTIRLPFVALACFFLVCSIAQADEARPNVLFIAVDDLRPQLGCYGVEKVKSPNIDRLAAQGMRFDRAYCMVPTCGASRASLITSIRPAPSRFVTHLAYAEKDAPGITALHTHFKQHGYYTLSNGKVLHHPSDSAIGWSEHAWRPGAKAPAISDANSTTVREAAIRNYQNSTAKSQNGKKQKKQAEIERPRGAPYEISNSNDADTADGQIAQKAIEDLKRLKAKGEPFFLATGFLKPHLPFIAPKKYWDLYPTGTFDLPANYHRPQDAPDEAIHNSGELRSYAGVPKTGPVSDEMARNLIHGYHACVSFTDAQVGLLLDELERLDLAKNTIVILWGDHGWNLGEHTLWNKHSCFEVSMRIPLIIRVPNLVGGRNCNALVESIDVYPTLCELAGLPIPPHVQGLSFVPLLKDPAMEWKPQVIGRFMAGDTIRTDTHRFTEYSSGQGKAIARMLYDHQVDADENVNISEQSTSSAVVDQLTKSLRAGKGKDEELVRK